MRQRGLAAAVVTTALTLAMVGVAGAHPEDSSDGGEFGHGGGSDGHVAANTNYGFEAVGHSALSGVQDGRYTDVWAHEGYAYVGSFQDPDCSRAGVYIADLTDPTSPEFVGEIKSPPDTRVNDTKVIAAGDTDVLIFSLEKCGRSVGSAGQKGQGGIALWDVTDPTKPHALKQNFLDFQVHNTYPWTDGDNTYALVVDDENIDDLHVIDLTKPQSPKLIATTGIGTWLADEIFDLDTSELFLGTFATPLLHDVWVEYNPTTERYEGVLSYWDAGFITVDLSDPSDPTFIADSDYLDQDPILAEERAAFGGRPEGNAHAAVFGGDQNQFIFGGDEDFDANAVTIASDNGVEVAANEGSDTPSVADNPISGQLRFVGLACDGSVPPADGDQIALIERGTCAFTTKAGNIEDAGYLGGVVFNSESNGCDAGVGMLVAGGVPMVSVTRGDGFALMDLDCAVDASTVPSIGTPFGAADVSAAFVGWGYFWALNNSGGDMEVNALGSRMRAETETVGHMGTIGYYAPEEVSDPDLADGAGDLSMHNLETDIAAATDDDLVSPRDRTFISWYALGMRAVEFRDGHYHDSDEDGQSVDSWNIHEVGRWIAPFQDDPEASNEDKEQIAEFAAAAGVAPDDLGGSNFWGVTQFEQDGVRYILGSDRNTGLWVFTFNCDGVANDAGTLYCQTP